MYTTGKFFKSLPRPPSPPRSPYIYTHLNTHTWLYTCPYLPRLPPPPSPPMYTHTAQARGNTSHGRGGYKYLPPPFPPLFSPFTLPPRIHTHHTGLWLYRTSEVTYLSPHPFHSPSTLHLHTYTHRTGAWLYRPWEVLRAKRRGVTLHLMPPANFGVPFGTRECVCMCVCARVCARVSVCVCVFECVCVTLNLMPPTNWCTIWYYLVVI